MLAAAARAAAFVRTAVPPASPEGWTAKAGRDFVTDVDRTAEQLIREQLLAAEPAAGFIGEESAPDVRVTRGLAFIVDPLDGTTNFLHGFPHYAVSIAAAVDGVLVAGVVHHLVSGRVCSAAMGHGAFAQVNGTGTGPHGLIRHGDGDRLHVSRLEDPAFALIGTGFPFLDTSSFDEYQRQFFAVAGATSGIRRAGSAALDLADVAAGRFDAFWEQRLMPWDVAAGIVLIREAGGVVTDLAGAPVEATTRTSIVAGGPVMHAWLLQQVGRGAAPTNAS
jgi:myo-inositol-1(or 4)-monophosphatase